jgi:LCP family protein required for cell wall assembly
LLLSIPRDYYVDVGEELKDKLTHTGINGIQSSINALENLLDININYYVKINFSSFEEIIDLLGGIDIESDTEYKLHNGNYSINKGTNHLDGKMALAFARERYAYINGDRTRVLNSQLILTKVVEKIKKYNNIKECLNIFKIVSKNISTNLSSKLIINYIINEIKNKKDFDVENYALDGFDSYEYTNSYAYEKLYVMLPDENSINEAKIKISEVLNS